MCSKVISLLLALALYFRFGGAADAFTLYKPIILHDLSGLPGDGALGSSVAQIGDVDGDGRGDVAVGAPFKEIPGHVGQNHGVVLVFSGASGGLILLIENPAPGVVGSFGLSVAGTGDLNGDAVPDLAVGASDAAYLISGSNGSVVWELINPNPTIPSAASELFGAIVVSGFDLNGDGRGEVLVGAPLQEQAFIYSGADASVLVTINKPPGPETDFGKGAAALGDLNVDGVRDFLIGASNRSGFFFGHAFVMSGADGTMLLSINDPLMVPSLFGWAAAAVDDLNGDGKFELLIGAAYAHIAPNLYEGRAFLFDGATGNLIFQLANPAPQQEGLFGFSVAALRDCDDDGINELVIGAPGNDVGNSQKQGQVFVFSGATGNLLKVLHDPQPKGGSEFGSAVARANYINNDSIEDLLVGARGKTINGMADVGQAFLFISTFANEFTLEPDLRSGTQAHLYLLGAPFQPYRIESTDRLNPADWSERANVNATSHGLIEFIDPPPLPQQRFYRAITRGTSNTQHPRRY